MPEAGATVTVALDAGGADLGATEVAHGAADACARAPHLRVRLYADASALRGLDLPEAVQVVDAPTSIAKAADPVRAVRGTPEASIVQAAVAVGAGAADALVSGGSTGPALAAALFHVKRARGVHRPALAVVVPAPGAPVLLLDVGANTEVRPEHLVQFAHMGAAYARAVLGIPTPRVALLSNGEEAVKGTPDVVAAHEALAGTPGFVGNVEGTGVVQGAADVVVCDGFTGNVALKTMEGVSSVLLGAVRAAATSSPRSKAGGALLKPALRGLRDELDPELQGGAHLLGLRRPGVVPHGRFTRRGFAEAVLVAERAVREDAVGRTHGALEAAGALRRAPSATGRTVEP